MKSSATIDHMIVHGLREGLSVTQAILEDPEQIAVIGKVCGAMARALREGRKLFFFGNGGSAADAEHLAAEFVGRFERERLGLPALALSANTATLTAVANDYSYEKVFTRQLQALSSPGDVAVGISTSGKSPNVLSAIRMARQMGVVTVGMTGAGGHELFASADYCIRVPCDRTARVQEAHILIGHILCEIVEESFADARYELKVASWSKRDDEDLISNGEGRKVRS